MKFQYLLILILFLIPGQVLLLGQDYIYKHFTTKDGLPSSEVYHVFQDSKGYIWFATDNGVSRYNGCEFENFDTNDGLAENSISEIYEDHFGQLWFIGMTGRLSYYFNDTIQSYKYNDLLSDQLADNSIYSKKAVYIDSLKNIYIGFKYQDLLKISPSGKVSEYKIKQSSNLQIIQEVDKKKYLPTVHSISSVDSFDSLYVFHDNKEELIKLPVSKIHYPHHLYVDVGRDSSFWFSSWTDVFFIKNKTVCFHKTFDSEIVWMDKIGNNTLWLCVRNEGIYSFQINNSYPVLKQNFLKGFTVSSTLRDNFGSYWFTTLNNGVFYSASSKFTILNKSIGLVDNKINAIETNNDTLWVAYNNRITEIINNKLIGHYIYNQDLYTPTNALCYNRKKRELMVATAIFLYTIKNKKSTAISLYLTRELRHFNAKNIISDKNNGYWVSSGAGFFHLQNYKVDLASFLEFNFSKRVNSLALDNNTLWLGCKDGLRKYANNTLVYLGDQYQKLKSNVLDLLVYNNTVILATKGKGILFFDGNSVKQITKADGLTSNTITCLALSDTILWAGSLNGLNKLNLHTNNNKFLDIKANNSIKLPGYEIKQIKGNGSQLYLATKQGLIKYGFKHDNDSLKPIRIYITGLKVNNETTSYKKLDNLKYTQNNIQIEFEALFYKNPQSLKYRYKLNGLDKQWITTSNREARYYYLKPGKYTFEVQAQVPGGQWSETKAKISFRIIPSIWQTVYFKIGLILLIVSSLILIYKFRTASNKNKTLLKKNLYTSRMQALVSQMNPHFIFNTLNSINNYILSNDKKAASKYLIRFSKLMRQILESSRVMFISLEEEIESLKLYLDIEALRLRNNLEYTIECHNSIDKTLIKVPSLLIQPFVENSIWHGIKPSPRPGILKILINGNNDYLFVEIIDNGVGRETTLKVNSKRKSLGSKITGNRFRLLAKTLKKEAKVEYSDLFENNECVGTRVSLTLPIVK